MDNCRGSGGFTLIELMIVTAIVGILAAIDIPNFFGMQKRAKTTEAKSNLGAVGELQEVYHVENDVYVKPSGELGPGSYDGSTGWAELGFFPKGITRYEYEVLSADDASFTARAKGDIDGDGQDDIWTIDEIGELLHSQVD